MRVGGCLAFERRQRLGVAIATIHALRASRKRGMDASSRRGYNRENQWNQKRKHSTMSNDEKTE